MFFHIASIEREVYWQIGNVTCSAYPLKFLDTIHSEVCAKIMPSFTLFKNIYRMCQYHIQTGELQMNSALNLIVFGPKLEHLDLIEYVIVDLLNVKYKSFIKKVFMRQFVVFLCFLVLSLFVFVTRPSPDYTRPCDFRSSKNSTMDMFVNISMNMVISCYNNNT